MPLVIPVSADITKMNAGLTISAELEKLEAGLAARKAQLQDLAMMGTVITSIHEIDAVLSVVMDMALRIADGEVGLIMLEESGELKSKISWGVQEDFVKSLIYQDGIDLATYCHSEGKTVILPDLDVVSDEGISLRSMIAVPIKNSNKCLGVAILINKSGGGNFVAEDSENLEMLLNFVAVAVENSRLIHHKLARQKMQQEMQIAHQIQKTLLPADLEEIPGVDIGAVYYPARDVGGDFYDIIKIDDKRFYVVLGDVSNKGVPAALIMSALSGILKSVLDYDPTISVSDLTEKLNDILARGVVKDREMFCTLFIAKFELDHFRLTWCNAGHPPGLFWDATANEVVELSGTGPIVGQFEGIPYKEGERTVGGGDRLFLFTDGLTEAMDAQDNLFGSERAEQVFSAEIGLSPKMFCGRVKEWVDQFTVGAAEDTIDDFTILQVKVD